MDCSNCARVRAEQQQEIERLKAARAYYDKCEADCYVERDRFRHELVDCYKATGADPDGNSDEMLAPHALVEVRRLRFRLEAAEASLTTAQQELERLNGELAHVTEELESNRACNLYTWKERAEKAESLLLQTRSERSQETTQELSRATLQPQLRAGEADPRDDHRGDSWQPITERHTGLTMIVTNNPFARNADGDMSHRWIGWIQRRADGEFICYDEADRMVRGLKMCHPLPSPPQET